MSIIDDEIEQLEQHAKEVQSRLANLRRWAGIGVSVCESNWDEYNINEKHTVIRDADDGFVAIIQNEALLRKYLEVKDAQQVTEGTKQ